MTPANVAPNTRRGYEDEADERPFKRLTRAEADALRARHPVLSPWRVVAAQAGFGAVIAALAWLISGSRERGAVGAVRRRGGGDPGCADGARHDESGCRACRAATSAFSVLFWSMVKIGASVLMLVLAPKVVQGLSWPALLIALVLCMQIYWFALLWRGALEELTDEQRNDIDMAAEGHAPTAGEYIVHHLTHLSTGKPKGLVDFSVVNWDSVFFSIAIGVLGCWVLWLAARKATAGVPGRFQAAVEILFELVDNEAKNIVHNATSRKFVGPLALTVFVWAFLLNAMDLLPVDLLPIIWGWIYGAAGHDPAHAYLRVVPTADLSITMGLSVGVLILVLYYSIKIKGLGGWLHELLVAPFGNVKLTATRSAGSSFC